MLSYFKRLKIKHQNVLALVITAGIAIYWRGITGFVDSYLFPQNPLLSHSSSVVIGISILVSSHYIIKGLT